MLSDAAVAVIRVNSPENHYLIVRRAINPTDPWSGHFALPGGRREPGDSGLLAACLRETREECGIVLPVLSLVAELPVLEAGNSLGHPVHVTPFLFELTETPVVRLDTTECAAFHWVPEATLRDSRHHALVTPIPGSDRRFPSVRLDDGHIWGFTYKVLANLLDLPKG
jgi:8-oxo-dGTP pyrophosphatase MutT (NUDIX family)